MTTIKWELLPKCISRDQVSFFIEASCDKVILKMFPTHIEVNLLPDPNDFARTGCPIEKVCKEIQESIKAGIEKGNSEMNCTKPSFTFYCQVRDCKFMKQHPARICSGKLLCSKSKMSCKFPDGSDVWMLSACGPRYCLRIQ